MVGSHFKKHAFPKVKIFNPSRQFLSIILASRHLGPENNSILDAEKQAKEMSSEMGFKENGWEGKEVEEVTIYQAVEKFLLGELNLFADQPKQEEGNQ